MAVIPKTKPMLAILDPITLPNEISEEPSKAACKLTKSSGADVAKETTVKPITSLEILNLNESATDERTRYSPPITKSIKPNTTKTKLIYVFFAKIL